MPANGYFSLLAGEVYNSDHSSKDYESAPRRPITGRGFLPIIKFDIKLLGGEKWKQNLGIVTMITTFLQPSVIRA
jgi:hypothetical protein